MAITLLLLHFPCLVKLKLLKKELCGVKRLRDGLCGAHVNNNIFVSHQLEYIKINCYIVFIVYNGSRYVEMK